MALDINLPKDNVAIADLAKYMRETRAAITSNGISGVSFEAFVEANDAVFLDASTNIWRRSKAGDPTRDHFHGLADPVNGLVTIFGIYNYDGWSFTDGVTLYVSDVEYGDIVEYDTGLACGTAIGPDSMLIESMMNANLDIIRSEVIDAREGKDSLLFNLQDMQANTSAVTTEVTDARGAYGSLDSRLSSNDTTLGNVQSELSNARGSMSSLDNRLDVSVNDDGTLKQTITASTWADEAATVSYLGASTIRVTGVDRTGVYVANRALRMDGTTVVHVVSSALTGSDTDITITGASVPNPLTTLSYSFNPNEMPLVAHSSLSGVLSVDEASTDTVKDKHVSNLLLKTTSDHAAASAPHAGHSTPTSVALAVSNHNAIASSEVVAAHAAIASDAEVATGTNDTKIVTPQKLTTVLNSRVNIVASSIIDPNDADRVALTGLDLTVDNPIHVTGILTAGSGNYGFIDFTINDVVAAASYNDYTCDNVNFNGSARSINSPYVYGDAFVDDSIRVGYLGSVRCMARVDLMFFRSPDVGLEYIHIIGTIMSDEAGDISTTHIRAKLTNIGVFTNLTKLSFGLSNGAIDHHALKAIAV